MKLSDYVMRFIAERGVRHLFMLPGGGAMHLNDSAGHTPGLEYVCNLHEQACGIAAEAYAKVSGSLGAVLVTTGPGGTNALTGVAAAWLDSTPCLFLSGQVKRADMIGESGVRQMGAQEIDIVSIVRPITKYAMTVMEPESIRLHLEKAVSLATSGRPGPVWLDIPLDVQASKVTPEALVGFQRDSCEPAAKGRELSEKTAQILELILNSTRPVILVGNGVRLAGAQDKFLELVERLQIPVLTTWAAIDLIPDSHPLLIGRPGAIAPRGANFALQNSDFLLVLGARLDAATTGYSHAWFARAARKAVVDIDSLEIAKLHMNLDVPLCADAGRFIDEVLSRNALPDPAPWASWTRRCREWKGLYPVVGEEHRGLQGDVSSLVFSEALSEALDEGDVIVPTSAGASIELFFLAFRIKKGQRMFHNRGTGAMGLALPSAIGACLASRGKRTVCIDSDGSIQFNIQELQTIARMDLPIKIFVLSNGGYASIRSSQKKYFGRLTGADDSSGLTLPDMEKIAGAYGLKFFRIENHGEMAEKLRQVLDGPGPALCDVAISADEIRAPCISSRQLPDGSMASTPLEDLWPFLDREEFLSNMMIPPID
jgi:acetolactate synthase I/II/III large subunit